MTRLERLAPLTGIVAVALFVSEAIVTGATPEVNASAQEVVSYLSNNLGTQEIAAGLFGLAALAMVWFGASLRAALREAAAGAERLGALAHAGTGFIAVGLAMYASFGLAKAHSVGVVPASTSQLLNVLSNEDMFVLQAVGAALLLLSTAIAVLRHGGLPRWIGWVSLVLGVVALVALALGPFASGVGFIGFLTLVLWIPVVSILIYRRQSPVA